MDIYIYIYIHVCVSSLFPCQDASNLGSRSTTCLQGAPFLLSCTYYYRDWVTLGWLLLDKTKFFSEDYGALQRSGQHFGGLPRYSHSTPPGSLPATPQENHPQVSIVWTCWCWAVHLQAVHTIVSSWWRRCHLQKGWSTCSIISISIGFWNLEKTSRHVVEPGKHGWVRAALEFYQVWNVDTYGQCDLSQGLGSGFQGLVIDFARNMQLYNVIQMLTIGLNAQPCSIWPQCLLTRSQPLKGFLLRWPTSVECAFRQDCYWFWTHGRKWHRAGWSGCGVPNRTGEQRRLELSCNLVWSVQTPDCSTWIWWPFLFLLIKTKCGVYTTNPTPFVASSGIFCKPWTFLQESSLRIQGRWQWWGPGGGRCWNMSPVHVWARCW